LKHITEKLGIIVLITLSLASGMALFFEDQFNALASLIVSNNHSWVDNSGRVLKIAYLFPPSSLNPFSDDPAVQARFYDVYQPLVGLDENFNLQPVLAVYYGILNDTQWEVHLRQGIKFHNGKPLTPKDVLYSFEMAKKTRDSVATDLVNSVDKIEVVREHSIIFTTKKSDPLLLNKLTKLRIIPDGFSDFNNPVGTGPYKIVDSSDRTNIKYERNEEYWDDLPFFQRVELRAVPNKQQRVDDLITGDIDLLVNVPPDSVDDIRESGLSVSMMPSLEVGFIMFNMGDEVFARKPVRLAVAKALNKEAFLDLAYGYAKTINQFVSNGSFGYNPDLKGYEFDQTGAEKELSKVNSGFKKINVKFYFPESLKLLGQYFREQLALVGMDVEPVPLTDQQFQEKLSRSEMAFYYLGWRNESGDALPFLKSVLHSKVNGYGNYNGMDYKNTQLDKLVEQSETSFSARERLKYMHEVMRLAVEEDVVGVPLFETQSLFAFRNDIDFKPRMDSNVYPSKIRSKQE
jgi:peptide/nickel transport system substrate-binding protein